MVGGLTEDALDRFHVDKLFLGVGGIDLEAGLTEFNVEDSQVKQALIRRAKECIVVTDSSKFGNVAFAAVAPISVVNVIVTDNDLDPEVRASLEASEIEVLLADASE